MLPRRVVAGGACGGHRQEVRGVGAGRVARLGAEAGGAGGIAAPRMGGEVEELIAYNILCIIWNICII